MNRTDSTIEELMGLVVDLPFAYFRLKAAGDRMAAVSARPPASGA